MLYINITQNILAVMPNILNIVKCKSVRQSNQILGSRAVQVYSRRTSSSFEALWK